MNFDLYRTPAEDRQTRGFDGVIERARHQAERERLERRHREYERNLALTDTVDRTMKNFKKEEHLAEMLSGNPLSAGEHMPSRRDRGVGSLAKRLGGIF